MKICPVALSTSFEVLPHKHSWEDLLPPPHPPPAQKSDAFIEVSSHTADDRSECTWTTQLIVMMLPQSKVGILQFFQVCGLMAV